MITRQKIKRYLIQHPEYVLFLFWLDHEFKHPILNYKGLAKCVESIIKEPLALLTEGKKERNELILKDNNEEGMP